MAIVYFIDIVRCQHEREWLANYFSFRDLLGVQSVMSAHVDE